MAKSTEPEKTGNEFTHLVETCLKQALPQRDLILAPLIETHGQSLTILESLGSPVDGMAPEDFSTYFEDLILFILATNGKNVEVVRRLSQMARTGSIMNRGLIRHALTQKLAKDDGNDNIAINPIKAIIPETTDGTIANIRKDPDIAIARQSRLLSKAVIPILVGLDQQALMAERTLASVIASGRGMIDENRPLPAIFSRAKRDAHRAQDDAQNAAKAIDAALQGEDGILRSPDRLMGRDQEADSLLGTITRESAKEFTAAVKAAEKTSQAILVAGAVTSNAQLLRITQREAEDLAAISLGNTLVYQKLLVAYALMEAMTVRAVNTERLKHLWDGVVATLAKEYQEITNALEKRLPANVLMTGRG